ncbi:MAG: polyprenyl synthetase family protein [Bacteroidales bacterium]|nr:polyprenyl synthetase family protein [Bacteroidales bacterium]MBQ6081648.1 polyprenyl synthetase family protein [Bacteroidales bacterium]
MIAAVKEYLGQDWKAFEKLFAETLVSRIPVLNKVNEYLIGRSGKQLRPMLCMLASRLCSGICSPASIRCAVASEMIHTATLLHDDVADASDTRRGAPTVRALISPTASVLVGDYWLSRGVITLIDACEKTTLRDFSECLGDLAEGEMFQIEKAESLDTTLDDYIYIIAHKTSSLFRAAMKSGARNVGCTAAQLEAIDAFALHLGLAFQMRDDILDYSPGLDIGKPTGQDILERKITLPLIGAFENAGDVARAAVVSDIAADRFNKVLPFVQDNGGIEYSQKVLEKETDLAVAALASFPDSPAKALLCGLARSLCLRQA